MDTGDHNSRILGLRGLLVGAGPAELFETGPAALVRQKASEEEEQPLTQAELDQAERFSAMLETAFLVAAADGELTETESGHLGKLIRALTEGAIPEADIEGLLGSYVDLLDEQGYEARFRHVAEVLNEKSLRKMALLLAAGIIQIDGKAASEETRVLSEIAGVFGFSKEEVDALCARVEDSLRLVEDAGAQAPSSEEEQ